MNPLIVAALAAAAAWFFSENAGGKPSPQGEGGTFPADRSPRSRKGNENGQQPAETGTGSAPASAGYPRGSNYYSGAIAAAEQRYSIPGGLLDNIIRRESNYNPEAIGAAGEIGIAQFMPATAADYSIDPRDPYASIDAAGHYLSDLQGETGDWQSAVIAYNWGIGNVQRKGADNAPASTMDYVAAVFNGVTLEG